MKGSDLIGGVSPSWSTGSQALPFEQFPLTHVSHHGGLVHHRPKAKQPWAKTVNQNNFGFRYFISTAGN